ncbi:hypothetical protein Elgi_08680 [Paenibacillus elgii]|nr:hypothetical protein Elgi_08680 [Paenibacillus elgii]
MQKNVQREQQGGADDGQNHLLRVAGEQEGEGADRADSQHAGLPAVLQNRSGLLGDGAAALLGFARQAAVVP